MNKIHIETTRVRLRNNNKGFSLIELVVAVGILLILATIAIFSYNYFSKGTEVEIATSTAYKSALNAITNPYDELTIAEVMEYSEREYPNVDLIQTGSRTDDLCIRGSLKGDTEDEFGYSRGNCEGAITPNPNPNPGDPTEPATLDTITTMSFMCTSTSPNLALPFHGVADDTVITMFEGSMSGPATAIPVVGGKASTVTMNANVDYIVTVNGKMDSIVTKDIESGSKYSADCLRSVEEFGMDSGLTKLNFSESNITNVPSSIPSSVTDLSYAFAYADYTNTDYLNDPNISLWNTENVTNMSHMFYGSIFNQPLNDWDVSNVTDMSSMFYENYYFNQPLDKWDVSKVENMNQMFAFAYAFNQPLNDWDVSSAKNTSRMFSAAFNQPLDKWDVSNVTDMRGMFSLAFVFDQDLSGWVINSAANYDNFGNRISPHNLPNFS